MAEKSYPNVENIVGLVIGPLFPAGRVGTVTPANLETRCPYGRVRRAGGADTDPYTDRARVVVDVFALTYAEGSALAEGARQALRAAPDPLDRVDTVTAPVEVPWADSSPVRRWTATYGVSLRRT